MRDIEQARRQPASPDRCAWCKRDRPDAVGLDTGEELCRPCHKWVRRYGRDLRVLLRTTPSFAPTFWPAVEEHLTPIFADLGPPVDRTWPPADAAALPVPIDECVFCGVPRDEWAPDVDAVALDSGEILCRTCLRDCRQFRRSLHNQVLFRRDYVPPNDRDRVRAAVRAVADAIEAAHDDRRTGWHGLADPTDATIDR